MRPHPRIGKRPTGRRAALKRRVISPLLGGSTLLLLAALQITLFTACRDGSGLQGDEARAQARYLAGLERLHEGEFGEAALELNASVEIDPSRSEAHHRLGEAYLGLMRYRDAEASFRQALMLEKDKYLSQMGLGHALRLQGRSEEALEAYGAAARMEPEHPGPHVAMGELLGDMGLEADSAEAFARAAELTSPEEAARPLALSAAALMAARDFEAAALTFEEVVKLLPEGVEGWLGLAEARVHLGELEKAVKAYETASRLDPDDTITMQLLAAAHEALGAGDEAVATYQRALRVAPESSRLWVGFSRLHLDAGRRDDAREAARKALEHLGGDDVGLIRDVADLLGDLGDAEQSAELYRLLLLEEDDPALWIALARQLHALGRANEVEGICERLAASAERNGAVGSDLAWCEKRVASSEP